MGKLETCKFTTCNRFKNLSQRQVLKKYEKPGLANSFAQDEKNVDLALHHAYLEFTGMP
jgi:hypothetical protein